MSELISIVIPCYNEARGLAGTLQTIERYFTDRGLTHEIVVVNDGSTDQTVAIAEQCGTIVISNNRNYGKGYSVRRGVLASHGRYALITDADLSTPIEEFAKLSAAIKTTPIVIGSRAATHAEILKAQPWYRRGLGKAGNVLVRVLLGLPIRDTQCGFKLFDLSITRPLFARQQLSGWGFDFELLFMAKQQGVTVKEIGVRWINDPISNVTATGYLATLGELLTVRWHGWRGRYR